MKMIIDEKYYDATEITKMLGLSVVTTRNLFRAGQIKGRKLGRNWYASELQIKDFMNLKKMGDE